MPTTDEPTESQEDLFAEETPTPPRGSSLSASAELAGQEAAPLPPTPVARQPSMSDVVAPLPKVKIPEPIKVDPFFRDPECHEQGRHRANCNCKGDARKPI